MKNRRYMYVILGLIFSLLLFYILYGRNIKKNYDDYEALILPNDISFVKSKNKWTKVIDNKFFNWKEYYIYTNNEYYGRKNLYYNEKWYIFEKDKTPLMYNGEILAFNKNHKVLEFNTIDIKFDEYINKVLEDNAIDKNTAMTSYYINLDLDGDDDLEKIYVVTNRFEIENISNKFFSYVFFVKNNNITYIYNESSIDADSYSGCKPYISNIFDIDDDKKYEIAMACSQYSDGQVNYKIYKYDKGKFNLLVSN